MTPEFERSGPSITEEAVAEFEARHGLRLPDDYREFLMEANGGSPRFSALHDEAGQAGAVPAHRLHSLGLLGGPIGEDDVRSLADLSAELPLMGQWWDLINDLEAHLVMWRQGGQPANFLPIGVMEHEPVLLLELGGESDGAVHLLYDPDGYDPRHCKRLAGSFGEFLATWPRKLD